MMKEQSSLSYLYGTNVPYIEDLYEAYLSSPDSVDSQWRRICRYKYIIKEFCIYHTH